MDQLSFILRMSRSILLLQAILYCCEGKSIASTVKLQSWNYTDLNLTDMFGIHPLLMNCSFPPPVYPEEKKVNTLEINDMPKISCNSYLPIDICQSKKSYDAHGVSLVGHASDRPISISNMIHCGSMPISCNSTNPFACIPSQYWSNRVVKQLDLSGIGLTYLPSRLFRHFTSLQYLNLSNNFITGYDLDFSLGLQNLQNLDISNNKLTEIDLRWMKHNTTVEVLILASNKISFITPPEPLNHSVLIDLTLNNLTCIEEPLEVFLKTNVTFIFDGNPLTCECMQSLRNGTYDNCSCESPRQLSHDHEDEQPDYTQIFVADAISLQLHVQLFVGAAFLLGSLITRLFMYTNRKTLCRCVRYPHDITELVIPPDEMETYVNHAYIVCDDKDHVILKMILLELEEKRHMKIVCDAREASPTDIQIGYIENCLSSSRRTVFVMSANFLENKLCLYVLKMAASMEYLEQKCVIIILKVKPFTKEQEKLLEKLTFHKICYEYPTDGEKCELFWNTLAAAINDPKLQFKILGIQGMIQNNIDF